MLGNASMVFHGAATHDFNPVDEGEVRKLGASVLQARPDACTGSGCTVSGRYRNGSVDLLAQAFGDTLLLVGTRSPLVTEDLDFSVGFAIMKSGEKYFRHVAFVDAHNCMDAMENGVSPATALAMEYIGAADAACEATAAQGQVRFLAGYAARALPFSRQEGFGDLGVQVLVVVTGNQTTAYVLFDGNNMQTGARDEIRRRLLARVDECEVMTTDTHVVNTISGRNQVGLEGQRGHLLPVCRGGGHGSSRRCGTRPHCRDDRVVPGDCGLWFAADLPARVHGQRDDGLFAPRGNYYSPGRLPDHRDGIFPARVLGRA